MATKHVEIELVNYKTQEIGHVAGRLIHDFSEYSGITGTESWPLRFDVLTFIRDGKPFNCIWGTKGMDITISYLLNPRPVIKEGVVVYISPEPKFSFIERPELMTPSVRTHVARVTDAIAEEMQQVYKLKLIGDPLQLVFPKEEYALSVDRFRVPLIGTQTVNKLNFLQF